ncbi:hypothetical protein FEM03_19590 [Phragmitibacter flavus]|uniref:PEP-CTERM sorting domain-containing protein n=1 Tax=Phragmitibacter flavus TaxID=2576071 RepID=A0A5R8K9S7_9BACT|nr:autotransporter-associated beta strand repeat-containing protein [Phragmitibacter flavus]TLD69073.1 hypothetical protein FEM03_19590 [Phragmitibacter flavus]
MTLLTLPCCLGILVFLSLALSSQGATLTWDGNTGLDGQQDGGGNWNTIDANRWFNSTDTVYQTWSNATPDSAIFGVNSGATGTQTVTLTEAITVNDITFNNSGAAIYTITGNATNKLTLSGLSALDTPIINTDLAANATLLSNPTITAVIAGTQGFEKTGTGTLVVGGTVSNEYTGLTTVSAGILLLDKTAGLNAINGDIDITGTGTLRLNKANQIANGASITLNGGTLWLGGNSETVANLTLNSGNSNGGTASNGGTFTVTDTLTINNTHGLGTNSGANWTANRLVITGTTTNSTALSMTGNSAATLSRFTIGSGGLSLSDTRTITLNNGTAADALGSQINLNGNVVANGTHTFNRSGTSLIGVAQIHHGTDTRTWQIDSGTTNVGITITGTGSAGLTKTGNGTLQFSGNATTANNYTGMTTLNGGSIKLSKNAGVNAIAGDITITTGVLDWDAANQIADTSTINLNGGSLKFDNLTETIANLYQSAGSVNNNNDTNGGRLTITGTLRVTGGSSINLNSGGVWSANTAEFTNTYTGNAIALNGNSGTLINRFIVGTGGLILNNNQNISLNKGAANLPNGPAGKGSELVLNGNYTGTGNINFNLNGGNTFGVAQVNLNGGQREFNVISGTTTSNLAIVSNTLTDSGDGTTTTAGGITKTGNGVLALTTANTYLGNTLINAGTLRLGANGSLVSPRIIVATSAIYDVASVTGGYTLASGQTLEGDGQILGNTTIASGANLSIGTVGGDLTQSLAFAAGLTLNSGSSTYLDLGTPADSDQLNVTGIFTQANGAKIIVDPNGFVPIAGQTYQLFTFGAGSTFSTNLGPLLRTGAEDNDTDFDLPDISASGFQWDVSQFTTSGIVAITPEPSRALLLLAGLVATLLPRRRKR